MKLADKLKHLRSLEGARRGIDRELTQTDVVRLMREEQGEAVTQPYLSQIEGGARRQLSEDTRELLARFYRVHPGYLMDDPVGYPIDKPLDLQHAEETLDHWLVGGAERFRHDAPLSDALLALSRRADTRQCLILIAELLETAQKLASNRNDGRSAAPAPSVKKSNKKRTR